MGIIKQGAFGGFLGQVGNIIGSSWRGIAYMRIKPLSVANPRTPGQLDQRNRFVTVIRFLRPFREFFRIGFKNYAIKMTSMNAAVRHTLKTAVIGTYPDYSIDLENLMVARGTLRSAPDAIASCLQPATVQVEWSDQSELTDANGLDKAMVVVYCAELGDVCYFLEAGNRQDAIATVQLPALYSGMTVSVWLAFSSLNELIATGGEKNISDSVYAGSVMVI